VNNLTVLPSLSTAGISTLTNVCGTTAGYATTSNGTINIGGYWYGGHTSTALCSTDYRRFRDRLKQVLKKPV